MRLNRKTLKCAKGKDYARMMVFSDLHLGARQCDIERAKEYLDWALKNHVYVLVLGDMIECGLTTSIGDSVYQQKLNPDEQVDAVVELLTPLAKAHLITGYHTGNHSARISKATSIDVSKVIARQLGVPYCGYACWHRYRVGNYFYTFYATHGFGGSKFRHTKMKTAGDLMYWVDADCILFGHLHSLATETVLRQSVKGKQVVERETHIVMTGSYLKHAESYAENHGYPINKLGSPTLKLMGDRKNISVSL